MMAGQNTSLALIVSQLLGRETSNFCGFYDGSVCAKVFSIEALLMSRRSALESGIAIAARWNARFVKSLSFWESMAALATGS